MKKFLACILCVFLFCGCSCSNEDVMCAKVKFKTVDGLSGLPIENVRIVIPENNVECVTGINGMSDSIDVSVSEKGSFASAHGTFTVIAYKEDYNDFVLFYAQPDEDDVREIKLYMFKKDTPMANGAPLATVESPRGEYVASLVEKYR